MARLIEGSEHRIRCELDVMKQRRRRLGETRVDRHMLMQGPATSHVHQLQAPAYAEHRKLAFGSGGEQRQFECISFQFSRIVAGAASSAVLSRIDVCATGQQDAVKSIDKEHGIHIERKVDRQPTSFEHTSGIIGVEPVAIEVMQDLGGSDDLARLFSSSG